VEFLYAISMFFSSIVVLTVVRSVFLKNIMYVETVRTQKMVGFQTDRMMLWMSFIHTLGWLVMFFPFCISSILDLFVLKLVMYPNISLFLVRLDYIDV